MTFGLLIPTTSGRVLVERLRTVRLFATQQVTGSSGGSFTMAGFDLAKGFIDASPINFTRNPQFSFDNTTKTLTWTAPPGASGSSSWRFLFLVFG